jgi:hypothetical protein
MNDETGHDNEEAFFDNIVHNVFHDKVQLMRSTPNPS